MKLVDDSNLNIKYTAISAISHWIYILETHDLSFIEQLVVHNNFISKLIKITYEVL